MGLDMKLKLYILFFLLLPFFVYAEFFDIEDYNVSISLNRDASFEVVEEIVVNFFSPHHGIYRTIPLEYQQDHISTNFDRMNLGSNVYKIDIYDVYVDGHPFVKSNEGKYLKIRIGDKNKMVSGIQKYVIKYKVYGAINFFDDHSEFYWNVIGHEWNTNIKKSSFVIRLPEDTNLDGNMLIFYGPYGSKKQIENFNYTNKTIKVMNDVSLLPREGVTVAIRFDKSYFTQNRFLRLKLFLVNNWAIFIPVIVLIVSHLLWLKYGKDDDIIKMVEYFPPEGLTPAEAGVIIDDKIDNRDIISLIFYWATKGIIKIEEIKGEGLFAKDDYILIKQKSLPSDAKSYEKILFDELFKVQNNVVISSLKNNFYTTIKKVRDALNKEIVRSNIYYKESKIFQILFMGSAIISVFFAFMMMAIGGLNNAVYLGISTVILLIYSFIMPKKTKIGMDKYKKIVGFKEFIDKTEKSKLVYLLNEDPSYFDKTLPYAVAFNMLDKWVKKFDGILKSPPEWYISNGHGFYIHNFGRSLAHSVNAMASNFTSAPSSAGSGGSGFSGGGSGGGFGGGGGGSW